MTEDISHRLGVHVCKQFRLQPDSRVSVDQNLKKNICPAKVITYKPTYMSKIES